MKPVSRSSVPAGLRAVFREQNRFKRHASLWAVILSLPVITWTWLLRFEISFWRWMYGGLIVGLMLAGGALFNPNLPLRWVERFVILLTFTFSVGKYIYLVYEPTAHELVNWLGEIQAIFWTIARPSSASVRPSNKRRSPKGCG